MRYIAISAIWLDFLTIQLFPSCSISSFFYSNCVYMSFTIIWKKIYITVDHRSYYYYMKVYYFFGVQRIMRAWEKYFLILLCYVFTTQLTFLTRFKLKFSLFFMCFVFFIYFCLFRFIRSKSEQYFFAATQPSALIHPMLGVLHYLLWFQFAACHSRVENRKLVFFSFFLPCTQSSEMGGKISHQINHRVFSFLLLLFNGLTWSVVCLERFIKCA